MHKTEARKYWEAKREGFLSYDRKIKDTAKTVGLCLFVYAFAWVMCS